MTHPDPATLNEYVDGALPAEELTVVDAHIEGCAECRGIASDLAALKVEAAALSDITPPEDVWSRIEVRLKPDSRRGWWMGLAAAAVLAAAAGGAVYFDTRGQAPAAPATAAGVESELAQAEAHYDNAIKGLEQIAAGGESDLDPATAATLKKNLGVIDQAIAESRAAVRTQPNSEPAQASLLENIKAKLALLEDTVALINEVRKGNGPGAARVAARMNNKG